VGTRFGKFFFLIGDELSEPANLFRDGLRGGMD
jgi:hypothetical protein